MARGRSKTLCCKCSKLKNLKEAIHFCGSFDISSTCSSNDSTGCVENSKKDAKLKEIISLALAAWSYSMVKCDEINSPKITS